jgi:predicted PurR-regulated permease PerM
MTLSSGLRALLAAASLVIVIAGLKIAAPVLVPTALAIFLAVITMPLVAWLRRRGVPNLVAIPIVILLTFGAFAGLVTIATQSLSEIRLAFPRYVERFRAMEGALTAWLGDRGIEIPRALLSGWADPERLVDLAGGALVGVAGFMSTALVVLIVMVFFLLEVHGFPAKIRAAAGTPDLDLSRYANIIREVQRYLAIKTWISLATGLLVGLWVWILGVDFPVFWGLVAFVLNYVPNVGSFVAAIPAIFLALVQLGMKGSILTALGYLVVNVSLGNVVEPHLMGRKLGLSPLVVMLSLVFWGYVWGPVGMLLSLPLTMIVRIMLENTESYRWVAVLLGPAPEKEEVGGLGPVALPEPAGSSGGAAEGATGESVA